VSLRHRGYNSFYYPPPLLSIARRSLHVLLPDDALHPTQYVASSPNATSVAGGPIPLHVVTDGGCRCAGSHSSISSWCPVASPVASYYWCRRTGSIFSIGNLYALSLDRSSRSYYHPAVSGLLLSLLSFEPVVASPVANSSGCWTYSILISYCHFYCRWGIGSGVSPPLYAQNCY